MAIAHFTRHATVFGQPKFLRTASQIPSKRLLLGCEVTLHGLYGPWGEFTQPRTSLFERLYVKQVNNATCDWLKAYTTNVPKS